MRTEKLFTRGLVRGWSRKRVSGSATVAAVLVAGLYANASGAPAYGQSLDPPSNCQTFAGVELCGATLEKYQELGGPAGALGRPIASTDPAPAKRSAAHDQYVRFTSGGGIYATDDTAHYMGAKIFARYASLGFATSKLGTPVGDEIANTGASAKTYGSRRADFSNGALYIKDGVVRTGIWEPYTPPGAPRTLATPLPPGSEPNTCPANTSAYPPGQDIYDCLSVDTQIDGYNAGVRRGVPDPTPGEIIGTGPLATSGFGLAHADIDHNVGYRAIRLLLRRDDLTLQLENPVNLRYRQTLVFVFDDQITESITDIVQRADDEFDMAPDGFDIGLITTFCADGSDPVKYPGTPHIGGRCPSDLPSPFGKDTGGSFPP